MNRIETIDSYWLSLFGKALIGCSGNIFLSKKRVVKRAFAITAARNAAQEYVFISDEDKSVMVSVNHE